MQDLSKFKLPADFRGRPAWKVQAWWIVQAIFINLSPQFMYGWRRLVLRSFGATIGKCVLIRPRVHVQYPWKLSVGDYSWIGDDVILYSLGNIKIGNNTVISQKTYLCTGTHDYQSHNFPISAKPIIIEDECWLAADVYVGPGVTIGKGTVVGARSSVFTSLPAGKICFGTPAKIVRNRTD
jgi:putative colanic acid biosynthesis acetyltransferase WcaF